jgi:hypothetical protein
MFDNKGEALKKKMTVLTPKKKQGKSSVDETGNNHLLAGQNKKELRFQTPLE